MTSADDREAIRDVLGRYCEIVDRADWPALGDLFAEAALCDDQGRPFACGADEVSAFFERNTRLYDGSPRTKHLVSNTIFEQQEPALVVTRSSYLVLQGLEGSGIVPIAAGWYRDTFRKASGGRWTFSERRYGLDLAGDISAHFSWSG